MPVGDRFQPGKAYGGSLAVVDTVRGRRAVCIILPDPEKPGAQDRLAQIFCQALNELNNRRQAQ